jgi:hypothetical protein
MSGIELDASYGGRGVLAWCRQCPSWREHRPTRQAAQLAAAEHVRLVHDDAARASQLREAAAKTGTRHADKAR